MKSATSCGLVAHEVRAGELLHSGGSETGWARIAPPLLRARPVQSPPRTGRIRRRRAPEGLGFDQIQTSIPLAGGTRSATRPRLPIITEVLMSLVERERHEAGRSTLEKIYGTAEVDDKFDEIKSTCEVGVGSVPPSHGGSSPRSRAPLPRTPAAVKI